MEWCFQRQLSRHRSLLHLYRHVMHMYRSGEGILGAKISTKSLKRRTRQEAKARAPQDEMGKRNRADRHGATILRFQGIENYLTPEQIANMKAVANMQYDQ